MLKKFRFEGSVAPGTLSALMLLQTMVFSGAALAQTPACNGGSWLDQASGSSVQAGLGLREPGVISVYGSDMNNGSAILPKCAYATGAVRIPVFMVDWAEFDPLTHLSNDNNPASTLPGYVQSSPLELGSFLQANLSSYFRDVSGNKLNLSFDTLGWLRSDAPNAYLKTRASYVMGQVGSQYCDKAAMMRDVVRDAVVQKGVDFANYDADGNGFVDGAVLVYKGGPGVCNGTNMSILNNLITPGAVPAFNWQSAPNNWVSDTDPNKALFATQTQKLHLFNNIPERSGNDGAQFSSIGTWAHELWHTLLGVPDLYYSRFNVGVWALSGYEGSVPSHPAAFEKWLYAKWINPVDITASGSYSVNANEIPDGGNYDNGTYLYRIALDRPDHFLTVEARWFDAAGNNTTRWATANGRESGLVIVEHNYAVDYFSTAPVQIYRYMPWRDGTVNALRDQNAAFGLGDVFYKCFATTCVTLRPTTAPGASSGFNLTMGAPDNVSPQLQMETPVGVKAGLPYTFRWTSSDNVALKMHKVWYRVDNSAWQLVPGCGSLPPATQSCTASFPTAQVGSFGTVRVEAYDLQGTGTGITVDFTFGRADITAPKVTFTAPLTGRMYTGKSGWVAWSASDDVGVVQQDLSYSLNAGSTWTAIAGCSAMPASVQGCSWTPPVSGAALLRLVAKDAAGNTTSVNKSVTLVQPSITVSQPNTVLTWLSGSNASIFWNSTLESYESVKIELSRDGGSTWTTLTEGTQNTGGYSWPVSGASTTAGRVRLSWAFNTPLVSDISDVNFTIANPALVVTSPNTAISWSIGSTQSITWNSNLPATSTVKIEITKDNGVSWSSIATAVPNSGSYNWVVTGPATASARVRVVSEQYALAYDQGDSTFTLGNPIVTVTAPNSAVSWTAGTSQNIYWNSNLGSSATVKIELSRDAGSTWETLAAAAPNTGSYSWLVAGSASSSARVRVSSVAVPAAQDISDVNFSIVVPSMSVTQPTWAGSWTAGTTMSIFWNMSGPRTGTVKIELSLDAGNTWSTLNAAAPTSTGYWNWTVAATATSTGRIRVSSNDNPLLTDVSDNNFTIFVPTLSVTSANTATSWAIGNWHSITWSSNAPSSSSVKIEASYDGGASWSTLAASVQNSGSYSWTVSGTPSNNARLRVSSLTYPGVADVNDADLQIYAPVVNVTAPNGGEVWAVGSLQTISWTSNLASSNTWKVQLSRDGGTTWETITVAIANRSFSWRVSGAVSENVRLRVTSNDRCAAAGISSASFSIR